MLLLSKILYVKTGVEEWTLTTDLLMLQGTLSLSYFHVILVPLIGFGPIHEQVLNPPPLPIGLQGHFLGIPKDSFRAER
jgi:hypothetical protein